MVSLKTKKAIGLVTILDATQRQYNKLRFDLIDSPSFMKDSIYQKMFMCLDILMAEVWDKFSTKEKRKLVAIQKKKYSSKYLHLHELHRCIKQCYDNHLLNKPVGKGSW